jgi:hypothetical protein
MVLSGQQWLDQVLRPTVAAVQRARHDQPSGAPTADALRWLGGRLAAQVEALGDTGVLNDEQESAALAALEDAGIMPEIRSASASASMSGGGGVAGAIAAVRAGSVPRVTDTTPAGPPRLLGVLAGPRPLGQLDGRPVTLISAELWSDRLLISLCSETSPEYRDRRRQDTREHLEWMRRQRRGEAAERPGRTSATPPLQALTWELRDEQATKYVRRGGSGESGDFLEQLRLQWYPPPSPSIKQLTLVATDDSGIVVHTAEIPLPNNS